MTNSEKHTSLILYEINYGRNKFYDVETSGVNLWKDALSQLLS